MKQSTKIYSNDLLVCRITKSAWLPIKATKLSAGHDLTCTEPINLAPFSRGKFRTDLAVKIPANLYGKIEVRSGICSVFGIDVGAGVIDSDYVGPIHLLLLNNTNNSVFIPEGTRVAQLVLCVRPECEVKEVTHVELWNALHGEKEKEVHGNDGFGSTGLGGVERIEHPLIPPSPCCVTINDFLEKRRRMLDSSITPPSCEVAPLQPPPIPPPPPPPPVSPQPSPSSPIIPDDVVEALINTQEGEEEGELHE